MIRSLTFIVFFLLVIEWPSTAWAHTHHSSVAPSLLIDVAVSNANPTPGEIVVFTIRYRCGSLTEHCYNTSILNALPSEMELIQYTLPGGNVSFSSAMGNNVTFNLSSPGAPMGQLDAGTTGMVKVWARFPNCGPSTPPMVTNTATISASGASSSSSNINVTQNGSTAACDTPPSGSSSSGLEKNYDQDDINMEGVVEWEIYFPATPSGETREYIDVLPAKMILHHIGLPDGVSMEIECNNSGIWRNPCNSGWLIWWAETFFPVGGGQHQGGPNGCPTTFSECWMTLYNDEERHFLYNITQVKLIVDDTYISGGSSTQSEVEVHMMVMDKNPFPAAQLSSWELPLPGDEVINCISGDGLEACNTAHIFEEGVFMQNSLRCYQTPWANAPIPEANGGIRSDWEDLLTNNSTALDEVGENAIVYCLRFRTHQSGGDLKNFTITDLLDPGLEFDLNQDSFWIIHNDKTNVPDQYEAHSQTGCTQPEFEVIPNFHNGRTLLRWTFDDCTMPGRRYLNSDGYLYFSATIKPGTTGTIENVVNTIGNGQDLLNNAAVCCNRESATESYWPTDYDHLDLDGDGITSEDVVHSSKHDVTIQTLADVTSSKWVKGTLDTDYSRYPIAGDTDVSGTGTYQLLLTNTGNVDITRLDIVDILPHSGDQSVLPGIGARNSTWSTRLDGDILLEKWNSTTKSWENAEVDVSLGPYYSTSLNPCRFENATSDNKDLTVDETLVVGPTGCNGAPWTGGSSATSTTARSFGLRYAPSTFDPGDSIRLTVNFALYGNPPGCASSPCGPSENITNGAVAWNSFAFGAIYDDGGSGTRLLDSEPIKVGLRMIDTDNYTSIGNYIWNDINGNGIQEFTEPGIPGIRVSLWNSTGTTLLQNSWTDAEGYYRFDGVSPSTTYLIRLDHADDFDTGPLKGFGLTGKDDPDNLGAGDDSDDSDADYNSNGDPEITATVGAVTGSEDPDDPAEYAKFDFGLYQTNSVGDYAWYDLDQYGDQGIDEPPVKNMQATLYNAGADGKIGGGDDTSWGVKHSDDNGLFLFDNVPNGSWYLDFDKSTINGNDPLTGTTVIPTDWTFTLSNSTGDQASDSDASPGTGRSAVFQLTGNTHLIRDAGLKSTPSNPATIQGVVWNDVDGNGQRNSEPFLSGAEVKLLDNNGLVLISTQSAGDGSYVFSNLPPGETYQVVFNINTTSTFTTQDQGSDLTDSDADTVDGEAPSVTPTSGQTISNIDAGVIIPPLIGDIVWQDLNRNGVQESGEPGLPGVTVDLYDVTGAEVVGQAVTDHNGYYQFGGYHNVNLIPNTSNTITITNSFFLGEDPNDAEEILPGGSGTVGDIDRWSSDLEMGDDGGDIQLVGLRFPSVVIPPTATLTNSYIQFTVDEVSTGAVTFSIVGDKTGNSATFYSALSGRTSTTSISWSPPDWSNVNDRTIDQRTPNLNAIIDEIAALSGWLPGNPISFFVERTAGTAKRVADSYYETAKAAELVVTYDLPVQEARALLPSHSYELRLSLMQSAALANLLTSRDAAGDDVDSDANLSGDLAVVGLTSPANGNEDFSYDIGLKAPEPTVVGNLVWLDENSDGIPDAGERGIPNVVVELIGEGCTGGSDCPTTTTDGLGGYLFRNVAAGTYMVRVGSGLPTGILPIYDEDSGTTSPDHTTTINVTGDSEYLTADFGYNYVSKTNTDSPAMTATGSFGDRIWNDANGDGQQDVGESGISGITLTLYEDDASGTFDGVYSTSVGTATTDQYGHYIFDGIAPGAYVVQVTESDISSAGFNTTPTSDPDGDGNNISRPVVIAPGDVWLDGDFGYQSINTLYDIGSVVFVDVDGSGNYLGGTDRPLGGVSIALINDTNGNDLWDAGEKVVATTRTKFDGSYLFPDLSNDDYVVVVTDVDNIIGEWTNSVDPDGGNNGYAGVTISSTDQLTQNFGYIPVDHNSSTAFVGDLIFLDADGGNDYDAGEPGIEGIEVQLLDGGTDAILKTAVTNENGHYFFGDLAAGNYKVRVVVSSLHSGLTNSIDPEGAGTPNNVSNSFPLTGGQRLLNKDFGYKATTSRTLSGTIWEDDNADGTKDVAETSRFGDITIVLLDGSDIISTTMTNGSGDYSFTGIPPDTYTVEVTDDSGLLSNYWHSLGSDSEPDPVSVDLSSGDENDIDFGYYIDGAALGNRVWIDYDGNDVQDTGEPGLPRALITLEIDYNADGTFDATATTLSRGDGSYSFGNLLLDEGHHAMSQPPPPFRMAVTLPDAEMAARYTPATADQGGNDKTDSDDHMGHTISTLTQGQKAVSVLTDPNSEPDEASADFGYSLNCVDPKVDYAICSDGSDQGNANQTTDYFWMDGLATGSDSTYAHHKMTDKKNGRIRSWTYCVSGDWHYYYNPQDPDEFLFAIEHGDNVTPIEYIEIRVDDDATNRHKSNEADATYVMVRDWHVKTVNDDPLEDASGNATTVNIRFYFPPNEYKQMLDAAKAKAGPGDWDTSVQPDESMVKWFKKDVFDPDNDIDEANTILSAAQYDITSKRVAASDADGNNTKYGASSSPSQPIENDRNHIQFNGITGFSGGTAMIHINRASLPVELSRFEGQVQGCNTVLTWYAETEENFHHYDLEWSGDGQYYQSIATISGEGSATNGQAYQYFDEQASIQNYYRLKMVDIDGSYEYSKVVYLQTGCDDKYQMVVYPNPLGVNQGVLNVKFYSGGEETELVVVDLLGRTLLRTKLSVQQDWNTVRLEVGHLPTGTYLLKQPGSRGTARFVVQR